MTQPIDAKQIDAEYEEWCEKVIGLHHSELIPNVRYAYHAARSASAQEIAALREKLAAAEKDVEWAEDQLFEVMRLASKGLFGEQRDDSIDDTLRLHGIRLLLEGQEDQFSALLDRVTARSRSQEGR